MFYKLSLIYMEENFSFPPKCNTSSKLFKSNFIKPPPPKKNIICTWGNLCSFFINPADNWLEFLSTITLGPDHITFCKIVLFLLETNIVFLQINLIQFLPQFNVDFKHDMGPKWPFCDDSMSFNNIFSMRKWFQSQKTMSR